MMDFPHTDELPSGLQPAPAEPRLWAAGARLMFRELELQHVQDKDDLMQALGRDLTLPPHFGHNWDALYDVLSDPATARPEAIHLCHLEAFRTAHPKLAADLLDVLLDAQSERARSGVGLWLLT
ncbi:barstar family protein [Deinococcus sonorensis]|uniref:Barstar family protein n=2 Tax=Deinococcus sonorensis TaxID=309891 RepID=A0AAU7UA10_9DEIO